MTNNIIQFPKPKTKTKPRRPKAQDIPDSMIWVDDMLIPLSEAKRLGLV